MLVDPYEHSKCYLWDGGSILSFLCNIRIAYLSVFVGLQQRLRIAAFGLGYRPYHVRRGNLFPRFD